MRTFEEIRVIDFTQAISRPFAAYQLDADVIKIEYPDGGDQGRQADASILPRVTCVGPIADHHVNDIAWQQLNEFKDNHGQNKEGRD